MVTLVWWGESVWGRAGEAEWRAAVADVAWAFGELSKEKDRVLLEDSSLDEETEVERGALQPVTTRKRM